MKDNLYKREMENKPAGEIYEEQAQAIDAMVNELLSSVFVVSTRLVTLMVYPEPTVAVAGIAQLRLP